MSWFGHISVQSKAKLSSEVNQGLKNTGCTQTQLSEQQAKAVKQNTSHPLILL